MATEFRSSTFFTFKWATLGLCVVLLLKLADTLGLPLNNLKIGELEVDIGGKKPMDVEEVLESYNTSIQRNQTSLSSNTGSLKLLQAQVASLEDALRKIEGTTDEPLLAALNIPAEQKAVIEQGAAEKPVLDLGSDQGTGVIWLGSYVDGAWVDTLLADSAQLPPPEALVASNQPYVLTGNVNVRQSLPRPVSEGYFADIPVLGVATKNTPVTVIADPVRYDRETGPQYWAKVQTTFQTFLTD